MAFLFKSKKSQNSALPAATRDISSSHGSDSLVSQNGSPNVAKDKPRPTNSSMASDVVNNSVNSLEIRNATSPEPKDMRDRKGSDPNVSFQGSLHSCYCDHSTEIISSMPVPNRYIALLRTKAEITI